MTETSEPRNEKDNEPDPSIQDPPEQEPPVPPTETPPAPPTTPEGFVPKEELEALQTRYKESGSEALTQKARAEQAERALQELTKEPTEPELRQAFPEWDMMPDSEKRSSKMAFEAQRSAQATRIKLEAREAREQRDSSVEVAITSHSELEGKEIAFKNFCAQPTHRSVDPEILVAAFLHKTGTTSPASVTPANGLEPGSGGGRGPAPSKGKYTAEEAIALQKSDSKKYRELLLKGELEDLREG